MSALSEVDLLILRVQACTLRLRRTDPDPSGELNALAEAQEGIEARMLQLRKGRRAVHRYQAAAGR